MGTAAAPAAAKTVASRSVATPRNPGPPSAARPDAPSSRKGAANGPASGGRAGRGRRPRRAAAVPGPEPRRRLGPRRVPAARLGFVVGREALVAAVQQERLPVPEQPFKVGPLRRRRRPRVGPEVEGPEPAPRVAERFREAAPVAPLARPSLGAVKRQRAPAQLGDERDGLEDVLDLFVRVPRGGRADRDLRGGTESPRPDRGASTAASTRASVAFQGPADNSCRRSPRRERSPVARARGRCAS